MRVERDGDNRAHSAGEFAGTGHEGRVPAMDAVEVADGKDSATDRRGRGLVQPERNDRHVSPELVQGMDCPSL